MAKSIPKFPKDIKLSERRYDTKVIKDPLNLREEFICPELGFIVTPFRAQSKNDQ